MTAPTASAASTPTAGTPTARLLVLAKQPLPGRVKTRLTPAFTAVEAAELAAAALEDTCATVDAAVELLASVGRVEPVLVLDGVLPARPGWRTVGQVDGGLDRRLAAAFAAGARPLAPGDDPVPTVLVGMDTPQLTPALLVAAVRTLVAPAERRSDACLGPATDGGWWLLGLRRPDPDLLLGLPMSVPTTGEATRRRLDEAGLSVVELPRLRDVDTADDARAVAAGVPGSCFARVHDHLTRVAS